MLKVFSPYDLSEIGQVPLSTSADADAMMSVAYSTYLNRDGWLPAHERIAILKKAAQLVTERENELVKIAVSEGGKPWVDSLVEVRRGRQGIECAIQVAAARCGEKIPMGITPSSTGRIAFTCPEPCGVVIAIGAFNHPFNTIVHQVIPAVAAGCSVVVKPAPTTPLSCQALVDILYEAGLPRHWCQVIHCEDAVATQLVEDHRCSFLTFIGSSRVGRMLRSKLPKGARCVLGHGGAAPMIIHPDGNLDAAMPPLIRGGYYHAGQTCVSVQRVYAHESIYSQVCDRLVARTQGLVVGDPLSETTDVGPLILPREVQRVSSWVDEVKDHVLAGGMAVSQTCYAPTVIADPPDDAKVSQLEIFGPVICVYRYQDRLEAINRANSLPFAFQAAVIGQDIDGVLDTASRLKARAVMINDQTAFRVDWMPFGGAQESGLGVGGIPYAIKDMTSEKLIVIRTKSP